MSNKTSSNQQTAPSGGGAARLVGLGPLALGAGFFVYATFSEGPPTKSTTTATNTDSHEHQARKDPGQHERFRYFEDPAEAHPLPVTLPPSEFQNQGIASTYRIAKDIPEVLAQQPCLCGCDNSSDDHRSLLDCYIDQHASTCLVCMKEAVLAEQMTNAGKSAQDIRDAILRHDFSEVSIGN
jgi:Protein of unknown function with PCYCGC motif